MPSYETLKRSNASQVHERPQRGEHGLFRSLCVCPELSQGNPSHPCGDFPGARPPLARPTPMQGSLWGAIWQSMASQGTPRAPQAPATRLSQRLLPPGSQLDGTRC